MRLLYCNLIVIMSSINNRQLFFSHLAQTSDKPIGIEVASAKGIYIYDTAGKAFMDMISGFSVCNIGHSHTSVIKAIQDQAAQYMHVIVYGEFIQSPQVQYAKGEFRTNESSRAITLAGYDDNGDALTFAFTQPANGVISGTEPNITWSNLFGYVMSSLWLIFTMKGMRWAYLRDMVPRTP